MGGLEPCQSAGKNAGGGDGQGADLDRAAGSAAERVQPIFQKIDLREDAAGAFPHRQAKFGGCDAARMAFEQACADHFLHLGKAPGQGGLREVDGLGRRQHALMRQDRVDHPQVAKLQPMVKVAFHSVGPWLRPGGIAVADRGLSIGFLRLGYDLVRRGITKRRAGGFTPRNSVYLNGRPAD